jgi:hypothetical protein
VKPAAGSKAHPRATSTACGPSATSRESASEPRLRESPVLRPGMSDRSRIQTFSGRSRPSLPRLTR